MILDECHFKAFSPQLKKELEKYKNLLYLSLNDCQLKSLEHFPRLPTIPIPLPKFTMRQFDLRTKLR